MPHGPLYAAGRLHKVSYNQTELFSKFAGGAVHGTRRCIRKNKIVEMKISRLRRGVRKRIMQGEEVVGPRSRIQSQRSGTIL